MCQTRTVASRFFGIIDKKRATCF
ncbi:hypothetical protein MXB_83 [Myxobolus squamalis]|nr:hypothetical protein MXB_83 [Myxobolus squamalis]